MTRRFGLALVAAVVIVCGAYGGPAVAQAPTTTAPASASPAGDALDNLAGCVRGSHQLLVLFLIDESGSLQKTDPGRQRVAAAASALDSLASLTATSVPAGERPQVQVAIAGFANAYVPAQDWTALDQQTLPGLRTTVRAFAKRNTGLETDFVNGLQGARDALAAKSALDSGASASQPCKAVLMFTDGKYDIARRTAANEKELGATKPYAPGIDLTNDAGVSRAIAAGVTALCRPGGLADGLRDDGTTMITVALATQIDKKA
ncbi:MAG TPA: vWA domain-containing protein, partial [Acidimicrobiales bacterium]